MDTPDGGERRLCEPTVGLAKPPCRDPGSGNSLRSDSAR